MPMYHLQCRECHHSYYIHQCKHIYSTEMELRYDYSFAYEYTYQDHKYIARTMNT